MVVITANVPEFRHDATIYLRGLPRGLRDMFRAACVRRGTNMTEVMIDFMREYVDNDHIPATKKRKRRKVKGRGKRGKAAASTKDTA